MLLTQNCYFQVQFRKLFCRSFQFLYTRSAHCCLVFAAKLAQCSDYEQRTWKSSWKVTRWMGNVFVIELKHMKHKAWNIMALFMCYKHLIVRGIIKAWSCRDLCHIYHLWVWGFWCLGPLYGDELLTANLLPVFWQNFFYTKLFKAQIMFVDTKWNPHIFERDLF